MCSSIIRFPSGKITVPSLESLSGRFRMINVNVDFEYFNKAAKKINGSEWLNKYGLFEKIDIYVDFMNYKSRLHYFKVLWSERKLCNTSEDY